MIVEKDKNRVASMLFGPIQVPSWVIAEAFRQLPEDTVMLHPIQDFQSAQWGWVLCSKKFPAVEEGAMLPKIVIHVDGPKKKVTLTFPELPESFMDELSKL